MNWTAKPSIITGQISGPETRRVYARATRSDGTFWIGGVDARRDDGMPMTEDDIEVLIRVATDKLDTYLTTPAA